MVVISFGNFAGKSSEINGYNRKFTPEEFVVRKVVVLERFRIFTDGRSHTIFFDKYGPNSVHRHKKYPCRNPSLRSLHGFSYQAEISKIAISRLYFPVYALLLF